MVGLVCLGGGFSGGGLLVDFIVRVVVYVRGDGMLVAVHTYVVVTTVGVC